MGDGTPQASIRAWMLSATTPAIDNPMMSRCAFSVKATWVADWNEDWVVHGGLMPCRGHVIPEVESNAHGR